MKNLVGVLIPFIILFAVTGCVKSEDPQDLNQVIYDINEEHKGIEQFAGDYENYMPSDREISSYISNYRYNREKTYNGNTPLTIEHAEQDVDILFEVFRSNYSWYYFYGGDSKFQESKSNILEELKAVDRITCEALEDILIRNLSFIEDGHFAINKNRENVTIPFFFREMGFVKTKTGYKAKDGRKVVSVENHEDLDELFRRSISESGEIIYYPIVLEKREFYDCLNEEQICSETLTIKFSDNSVETLIAEPYKIYVDINSSNNTFMEKDGIPIIITRGFDYRNGGNAFATSGINYKEEPITILDIASNLGGDGQIPFDWLEQYTGEKIPSNSLVYHLTGRRIINEQSDQFVEHDNILILITGKYTASAAELLIDKVYNLENSMIIGENTMGAIKGGDPVRMQLPNSNISLTIPSSAIFLPEDNEYFQELRGFYPDFWVPAAEAQDAAIRLVHFYEMTK